MTMINFEVDIYYISNLSLQLNHFKYFALRDFAKEHNCHMYESDCSIFSATEEDLLLLKLKHPGAITHIRES